MLAKRSMIVLTELTMVVTLPPGPFGVTDIESSIEQPERVTLIVSLVSESKVDRAAIVPEIKIIEPGHATVTGDAFDFDFKHSI